MTEQQETTAMIELTPVQFNLTSKYADTILNGTLEQAGEAFTIIFDRDPESEMEMAIFQAMCKQMIQERDGDYGIKGVITNERTQ